MQVVGRADAYIIKLNAYSLELVNVPVKPLELHEKVALREVAVELPDAVKLVEACQEAVICVFYGSQVPFGYIAGDPYETEVLRCIIHKKFIVKGISLSNNFSHISAGQPVFLAALGADGHTSVVEGEPVPVFGDPSCLASGVTYNQGEWFYRFRYNRSGTDK